MPPLILHNVPDDELYVGEDGVARPYGVYYPHNDGNPTGSRMRRAVPETGSFGKSTRRSRSKSGTPAAAKREDPTLAAADAIFSQYLAKQAAEKAESTQRKPSIPSSISQQSLSSTAPMAQIEGSGGASSRYKKKEPHKEPTEVILRGFNSTQQYAAIHEYERIGGRICEDYPRDPPLEQRRFKADLRDPATLRRKPMTAEEKAKALKFAGGEHWIKVTFESAETAEKAVESSPQEILGHTVYAELYRGVPPAVDEEILKTSKPRSRGGERFTTQSLGVSSGFSSQPTPRPSTLPRSFTTPSMREIGRGGSSLSPPESHSSSHTLETATISSMTGTVSSGTVTGFPSQTTGAQHHDELLFCRKIPTAKRIQLLPAEQALLPQQSFARRVMSSIPLVSWLSADIIGNAVPRTEQGEFDWEKASMYWKIIWFVDSWTGWFDICIVDKDE